MPDYREIIRNPHLREALLLLGGNITSQLASDKQNTYTLTIYVDCQSLNGGQEKGAVLAERLLAPYCDSLKISAEKTIINGSNQIIKCELTDSSKKAAAGESRIADIIDIIEQARTIDAISKAFTFDRSIVFKEDKPLTLNASYFKFLNGFMQIEPKLDSFITHSLRAPYKFTLKTCALETMPETLDRNAVNDLTLHLQNLGVNVHCEASEVEGCNMCIIIRDVEAQKTLASLCREYRELAAQRGK